MSKRESCENTDYTSGFKIHREKDGTFVAVKGNYRLEAKSAGEIDALIKNFHEPAVADAPKKKSGSRNPREACVRNIAEDLKKDNWLVKANTEGWEKPSAVGGVVPDVMAHKGCLKRICQVVTKKDFEGNEANWRDFKNYCKDYDFQLFVIDEKGKTKPVDLPDKQG